MSLNSYSSACDFWTTVGWCTTPRHMEKYIWWLCDTWPKRASCWLKFQSGWTIQSSSKIVSTQDFVSFISPSAGISVGVSIPLSSYRAATTQTFKLQHVWCTCLCKSLTILKRKIFGNVHRSWQRILKTAKILGEYEDFDQDLSGFSKILESLVPILGSQKQRLKGSERWN